MKIGKIPRISFGKIDETEIRFMAASSAHFFERNINEIFNRFVITQKELCCFSGAIFIIGGSKKNDILQTVNMTNAFGIDLSNDLSLISAKLNCLHSEGEKIHTKLFVIKHTLSPNVEGNIEQIVFVPVNVYDVIYVNCIYINFYVYFMGNKSVATFVLKWVVIGSPTSPHTHTHISHT